MFRRKKITCYVLIFDQVDIIKRSLDFLVQYANKLDLIIIENPSPNTPKIKSIVDTYGKSGLIKRYYLFEKNITGNAYDIVFNVEKEIIKNSPYILITDGDLYSKDEDWLKEELNILKQHPEVFACGVSLDMSNLPIKQFPDAANWIPPDKGTFPDFFEATTGGHLLMFRGGQFYEYMKWQANNKLNFVDSIMHRYCYEVLNKKWARTKKAKAYHLTWDLYRDKRHPYTVLKISKTHEETWYHKQKSGYKLTEY
jgi:hypothetical protein